MKALHFIFPRATAILIIKGIGTVSSNEMVFTFFVWTKLYQRRISRGCVNVSSHSVIAVIQKNCLRLVLLTLVQPHTINGTNVSVTHQISVSSFFTTMGVVKVWLSVGPRTSTIARARALLASQLTTQNATSAMFVSTHIRSRGKVNCSTRTFAVPSRHQLKATVTLLASPMFILASLLVTCFGRNPILKLLCER